MRWTLKAIPNSEQIKALARDIPTSETIAQLLIQRGIHTREEARAFFNPDFDKLYDPFLMKDMSLAVTRLEKAIKKEENIMVYGDYDVDGTTSVALMATYLETHSDYVTTYIPDREKEGYGISLQGIDYAADNDISLIVALDCGIKAVKQIEYARKKNIDFIICDHHLPGEKIPEALAVLDPKRPDCAYPFKELCGCGVGFKLIQAIHQTQGYPIKELYPYLDLVATAIGADIVPIVDENRILAFHGLKVLNSNPRPGLKALIAYSRTTSLTMTEVVFQIAPRINAAGRMEHALKASHLLMEQDWEKAKQFAQEIETYNASRKNIDREITKAALAQIETAQEVKNFTTVVYHEDWHKGVIGIVASRLTETYYRPTLVFTKSGGKLAASARSVKDYNIYKALEACSDHIEQFGGHKYAAGLTLEEQNYAAFKQKFEKVVAASISQKLLTPEVEVDMEIEFNEITSRFFNTLQRFAPFGPENMRPVFMTKNVRDTGFARTLGADHKHLRCHLVSASNPTHQGLPAIGFNLGNKIDEVLQKKPQSIVYTLGLNEWKGHKNIQLSLKDIR